MKQDSDYSGYNYELFSGLERTSAYEDKMYVCPISSTYQPKTSIIIFDAKYIPFIEVVEPHDVITPSASWGENAVDFFYNGNRRCWQPGEVGSASLVTINYIGPIWVSFRGVSFSEIPCYEEDEITGCFTNGHTRTHTVSAGAGAIHYIQDGNYFFTDSACSNSPERNWLANSTMIWRIPIGWHRIDHLFSDGTVVEGVDYERSGDIDSRPLLIGNCTDYYTQARHIDATGVYRTDKFGHWISRSPNCRVILDGNIMQDHHAE